MVQNFGVHNHLIRQFSRVSVGRMGGEAGAAEPTAAWTRVRKFVAGYASGVSLVAVGHPFDTIKVRMQSEGAKGRFNGVWDCLKTTVTKEGVGGLYKGAICSLVLAVVPS